MNSNRPQLGNDRGRFRGDPNHEKTAPRLSAVEHDPGGKTTTHVRIYEPKPSSSQPQHDRSTCTFRGRGSSREEAVFLDDPLLFLIVASDEETGAMKPVGFCEESPIPMCCTMIAEHQHISEPRVPRYPCRDKRRRPDMYLSGHLPEGRRALTVSPFRARRVRLRRRSRPGHRARVVTRIGRVLVPACRASGVSCGTDQDPSASCQLQSSVAPQIGPRHVRSADAEAVKEAMPVGDAADGLMAAAGAGPVSRSTARGGRKRPLAAPDAKLPDLSKPKTRRKKRKAAHA